jgi:hypothetical protein
MSDNARRYSAIFGGLKKLFPTEPTGNHRRHLNTLAMIISGIVGSKRSNLPDIAAKVADLRKPESRIKSFSRLIDNERVDYETYYLPYVTALLQSLLDQPLKLIFDGSEVGRNCITLMACVVYKGRALPLCWITRTGKKGHFPEELHLDLLKQVHAIIPEQADVIFLGDGEFDGMDLIKQITDYGWQYVCRTAVNRIFEENGEPFSLRNIGVSKGGYFSLPKVYYSNQAYGPFHVIVWWEKAHEEPIYLITNFEVPHEAFYWYKKRFHIETFFSDKKSRGFHLHKSHISDPDRIKRLMIATCLAYIWIVFLGALAMKNGWNKIIHRTDRCDLSLFKLGLRVLDELLNMMKDVPVAFQMDLFDQFEKSVR